MADSKRNRRQVADPARRSFLSTSSSVAMLGALVASYGTFAAFAGRFLYPAKPEASGWMFVAAADEVEVGQAIEYKTPGGNPVTIKRSSEAGRASDFIALGATCPHLGCIVKWEQQNNRFFCPCHNGVFDQLGVATEGPPADAHQKLPEYPIKIDKGILYINVPLGSLARGKERSRETRVARAGGRCGSEEC